MRLQNIIKKIKLTEQTKTIYGTLKFILRELQNKIKNTIQKHLPCEHSQSAGVLYQILSLPCNIFFVPLLSYSVRRFWIPTWCPSSLNIQ